MIHAVAVFDTLAFAATMGALILIICRWKAAFARDVRMLIGMAVAMTLLRNLSNVLEWAEITARFDPVEDYVEILLPMMWGFVVYALLQDLDNRERMELNRSLALKNKELQSVVYIASHDLRSPLVNIRGFSHELACSCTQLGELLDGRLDEQTRQKIKAIVGEDVAEALKFINAGAENMERITDGLLKLSRAGTEEIAIRPLNMNELILCIRQAVSFQIEQKNVAFTLADLPPCLGDESQIAQVFANLIDNALKYLQDGRPGHIAVTGWSEGDRVVYCVRDNGIGIDPRDCEKVFEVFCRLHPDKSAGEGLGLNIVSRILERHGGAIRLESEPGRGTAFYVVLPKP